jgi:hypothetical protein
VTGRSGIRSVLGRLIPPDAPRRVVREAPDELGYTLAVEPLLDVMPAAEWRRIEHAALAGHQRQAA